MLAAMAQLYVYGHDLDFRTLFRPAAAPEDFADIPPTRFRRKEHWLNARFSADGSALIPGTHVATPDGRHVWEYAAAEPTDLAALVKAAAAQVLPDATLIAAEQRAVPGEGARLVTTLARHPGGASVQVHARIDESFTLVYDAIVSRGGAASALPAAVATGVAVAVDPVVTDGEPEPADDAAILHDNLAAGVGVAASLGKWSPDSGETVHDRLSTIVGSAMGYEPEDLPWEVPLIELGLDSLMAVRIKNRVEYDFDLPPIQLTAVRDANLYAVEKLIQYAIENREAVTELAEHQKGMTAEEIAAEQARIASGEIPPELAEKLAAKHPEAHADIPPPPTNPAGPAGPAVPPPPTDPAGPSAGPPDAAPGALSQHAVVEALGTDVPPREAAERVTFATWAIVTGKSPGGIFNELPGIDDDTAAKIAQRLTERCRGSDHRRAGDHRSHHRGARDHRARVSRSRRTRRFRTNHQGAQRRLAPDTGVRVPSSGRLHGGLRTAAQATAGRHPDVRAGESGRFDRGAGRRVCAEASRIGR